MSTIDFLNGVLAAELGLTLFLMFGHRGLPWYRRAWAAMGSAGVALSVLAVVFGPGTETIVGEEPSGALLVTLLFADIGLALMLIMHFYRREVSFSCLGAAGRMIGCAAVAWGSFAVVALSLGSLIALTS